MRNWLVRPPFSENPPITLRFDASSVGLLLAVWSLLALIQQSVALGETASALSAFSWQALSYAPARYCCTARQAWWSGRC